MKKDLFETPEKLPTEVQKILLNYSLIDPPTYKDLENMLKDLSPFGYVFDYYLDCVPFNLRKF